MADYPLISVVVPVYNVKKYLEKCLLSLAAQDYPHLEVVVVDDGSTDESGQMCDAFCAGRENFRVIHQKNGGLSAARNTGVQNARGSLVGFVDSDDYIEKDMFSCLYQNMKDTGSDLSICSMFDCYPGKEPHKHEVVETKILTPKEAVLLGFDGSYSIINAVNKLYKKELFETIQFPVGKTFEDAFVFVDVVLSCEKIVFTTAQKYYYVHREDSITSRPFSRKSFHVIEAYEKNYKTLTEKLPEVEESAFARKAWAYGYVLDQLEIASDRDQYQKEEKELFAFIRQNIGRILRLPQLTKARKLAFVICLFSKSLYRATVKRKTSPFNIQRTRAH